MTTAPLLFVTLLATPPRKLATPLESVPVIDSLELSVPMTVAKAFFVEFLSVSLFPLASYGLD